MCKHNLFRNIIFVLFRYLCFLLLNQKSCTKANIKLPAKKHQEYQEFTNILWHLLVSPRHFSVSGSLTQCESLTVELSVCEALCLWAVCLESCLSVGLSILWAVWLWGCMSVGLYVYGAVCLLVCLSVELSVYVAVCLWGCLSVRLPLLGSCLFL